MKFFISLTLLVLSLTTSGVFADNLQQKPVYELFEITNLSQLTKQMTDQVEQQMKTMVQQQLSVMDTKEDVKKITNKYVAKMADVIVQTMSWERMKEKYAAIYESVLTDNEILQLIDFLSN
ncbi:MAG: hypothetical protein V3W04_07325 [Gammaproteobacteria bacterium]